MLKCGQSPCNSAGDVFHKLLVLSLGLFQKSLITYENYYGKDHIEVARLTRKLGSIYFLEGQLELAKGYLKKALEIFQKINHPEKILVLEELSKI